jgi:hypothetical protein
MLKNMSAASIVRIGPVEDLPSKLHAPMLAELQRHESGTLLSDLSDWLPETYVRAYETNVALLSNRLCYRNPQTKGLEVAPIREGQDPVYWDGEWFRIVPWAGLERAWFDEYASLASRVIATIKPLSASPVTIIDLGCGIGTLTLHVALQARAAGLANVRFVAIDYNASGVQFCAEMAKRHGIDARCVLMDLAHVSADPAVWPSDFISQGDKKIVVTRGALHPYYTTAQYEEMFGFLLGRVGVTAGVHLEYLGFRTKTYEKIVGRFPEVPRISPMWTEQKSDPFRFLCENAGRLGIDIRERVEIWQHFPYLKLPMVAYWPSYLSWSVTKPAKA